MSIQYLCFSTDTKTILFFDALLQISYFYLTKTVLKCYMFTKHKQLYKNFASIKTASYWRFCKNGDQELSLQTTSKHDYKCDPTFQANFPY